jgi:hypothetical protein
MGAAMAKTDTGGICEASCDVAHRCPVMRLGRICPGVDAMLAELAATAHPWSAVEIESPALV